MAKLLFRLNGVSDDEANEVRQLLDEAGFDTYETDAGRWRISLAAIWLRNDADFGRARALIEDYQQQRSARLQEEFQQRLHSGDIPGIWQRFRERPVDFVAVAAAIALILGLMLWPFMNFFN